MVPGDPENSLLIKAVKQVDPALKMPSGGKLKDAEIADLEAWVKAGAVWPKSAARPRLLAGGKYVIAPERREFWSLLPLANPAGSAGEGSQVGQDDDRPFHSGAA